MTGSPPATQGFRFAEYPAPPATGRQRLRRKSAHSAIFVGRSYCNLHHSRTIVARVESRGSNKMRFRLWGKRVFQVRRRKRWTPSPERRADMYLAHVVEVEAVQVSIWRKTGFSRSYSVTLHQRYYFWKL